MCGGRSSAPARSWRWCASPAGAGARERSTASASRPRAASLPAGGVRASQRSPARSRPRCGAATAPSKASRDRRNAAVERRGSVADARRHARERALRRDPPGRDRNRRLTGQRPSRDTSLAGAAGRRSRVLPMRPADPSWRPPGGALLLKALPAGRLARRLRERSGRSALAPPERCALCDGPMPTGVRPEARYCSKRCRQAASRARLAVARERAPSRAASAGASTYRPARRSRPRVH